MATDADDTAAANAKRREAWGVIQQCLSVRAWVDIYPILHDNFALIDEFGGEAIDAFEEVAHSEEFGRTVPADQLAKYQNDIVNVRNILAACRERGLSRAFAYLDLQTAGPSGAPLAELIDRIEGEPDVAQRVLQLQEALQLAAERSVPLQALLHFEAGRMLAADPGAGDGRNVEEALEHLQWALATYIRDADWRDWALAHFTLGELYARRTEGDLAYNIDRNIEHFALALQFYARTTAAAYAQLAVKLASCWARRLNGSGRENLANAIQCCEGALRALPPADDPSTWALAHAQLCEYLVKTGPAKATLADVIAHADAASEVLTEADSPAAWGAAQYYVGRAYVERYFFGDRDPQALEHGIERLNAALRGITPANDEQRWAEIMTLLGDAYKDRSVGDLADNIERAIESYERALDVAAKTRGYLWAVIQNGLGTCYARRIAGDPRKNRAAARAHYEDALQVADRESSPTLWAMVQMNLGTVYWNPLDPSRSEYEDKAIEHTMLALEVLTQAEHPYDWAALQTNLANFYVHRSSGSPADNVARAMEHATAALQVRTREAYPADWAQVQGLIGSALMAEADFRGDSELRDRAAAHFDSALEIYRPDIYPEPCRRMAEARGDLAFARGHWTDAVHAYEAAAAAVRILYESALFRRTRRLQQIHAAVHHRAAYALARLGRAREAVVMFESGRALEMRSLLEAPGEAQLAAATDPEALALYRQAQELDRVADQRDRSIGQARTLHLSSDEAAAFASQITERTLKTMPNTVIVLKEDSTLAEVTRDAFANVTRVTQDEVRRLRTAAAACRRAAVERLRGAAGLERFAGEPTFDEIADAVTGDWPLVFIASTTKGSIALIVYRDRSDQPSVDTIWLDDFSTQSSHDLVFDWYRAQHRPADLEALLQPTLAALAAGLMRPVVTRLKDLGMTRAALLPSGTLSLLPLHAACTGAADTPHSAAEGVDLAYAPSARAVAVARAERRARATDSPSLLAVGNPRPGDMPLPFARDEVTQVSRLFNEAAVTTLFEDSASIGAVLHAASAATHVHFASHCVVDWAEPLYSRLELSDIPLHLRDVFYEHAHAWKAATLVVVSACQSGAPDATALDEGIGWPAAFLLAGVPAVVAAQWPVDDVSTALLMSRFYELLLGADGEPPMEPAAALSGAQRWMRTVTLQELRERVTSGASHENIVAEIAARCDDAAAEWQPFIDSPFDWAAFAMFGA